ncbi:MAG: FG-GAP-like repeat-containing protein, partial [Methylovulum sp.]|nr:FG-GAP-like repeat-containing protein [Methylovulum sp.]
VNGDGRLDVLSANASSDTVSLLLGNGQGGFAAQQTFAVDDYPFSVSVGDVNGDGRLDVLTANAESGNVSLLLGNGQGGFATQQTFAVGDGPQSVSVGDVNGDGRLDVLTANAFSDNVSLLVNQSDAAQTPSATLTLLDVAKAGFTLSPIAAQNTGEDGTTASYSLRLNTAPLANQNVTLTFTSSDTSEGVLDNPTLIFTSSNWATAQTLTVRGVDDDLDDGAIPYQVTAKVSTTDVFYKTLTISPLSLSNADDGLDIALDLYGDEGGSKVDVLVGGNGADKLHGLNKADDLSGGLGNDSLWGGYGDDYLRGDAGDDYLEGEQKNDRLEGGEGNDFLYGTGGGLDTLIGGAGNDTYYLDFDTLKDVITDNGLAADSDTVVMPYNLTRYTLPAGIEQGTITEGTQASSLTGNASDNTLTGNAGKNTLSGAVGRDSLFGGLGNDVLNGGVGNDALTGGTGKDTFLFNSAITANTDKITDFKPVDDTIKLENQIFTKLTVTGVLNASQFVKGANALDPNDVVIYNPTTGAVTYDADGSGAGFGVQIAVLGVNLALTNADFVVI